MENVHSTLHNSFGHAAFEQSSSNEVLVKLDSLLANIDLLLEKMRKTGSHVEKVKNNTYFHP
mgnify:CR=1 FL=1